MDTNPKISVIIPVYNVQQYLVKCIESILSQTYSNFELLIIDDGSTDKSGLICDNYVQKDSRIKVFHKKNGGVSSSRNLGLDMAKGKWLMFVDSDDSINIKCLEKCLYVVRQNKLDVLQFSYDRISTSGTIISSNINSTEVLSSDQYIKEFKFNVCVWGTFIKRLIVHSNRIRFNDSIKLAEDQLFIMEVIKHSHLIQRIDDILYYYLDNINGATHNSKSEDMIKSCNALILFSGKWSIYKRQVDSMVVYFIISIIRNNDISINIIYNIYKKANILNNKMLYSRDKLIFIKLARLNFKFACCIILFKYKIKGIILKKFNYLNIVFI